MCYARLIEWRLETGRSNFTSPVGAAEKQTRERVETSFTGGSPNYEHMSNRLFIGGLSWDTDDAGLSQAFSRFGTVSDAKVILDRDTGRSRGFGFVTLGDATQAQTAQREMDGSTLDDRQIRVNEAQDRNR